jgi:hypothetical protein
MSALADEPGSRIKAAVPAAAAAVVTNARRDMGRGCAGGSLAGWRWSLWNRVTN